MDKNTPNPRKTSRRSFAKNALTSIALAPLMSLTTRATEAQDNVEERQSSPITIGGGGSVGIDFSSIHYTTRVGKAGFSHTEDTLHRLWLIDKYGALKNITPEHEDCVVKVQCKKGSKWSEITITGRPLTIDFDTGEFPKKKPDDGAKELHHNKKYKIVKIEVLDNVTHKTIPYEPPTKGKCTIVVVNSL